MLSQEGLPKEAVFLSDPKRLGRSVLQWYQRHKKSYPWRLSDPDPYKTWVSEIMLQQTVIKAVLPKYRDFLEKFPHVDALATASEDDIRPVVAGLGYYRRFRLLHRAAQELSRQKQGAKVVWPETAQDWQSLPGVGHYTAAAVSSICFNYPVAVIDGNVERVICRLLDIQHPPNLPKLKPLYREATQKMLVKADSGGFNQGMMELGQTVCMKHEAKCGECPIQRGCLAFERGTQKLAPAPKTQKPKVEVALKIAIPRKGQTIGMVERPAKAKFLKGILGFPTFIEARGRYRQDGGTLAIGQNPSLGTFRHAITHHKITVNVIDVSHDEMAMPLVWLPPHKVKQQLSTSLDLKCWDFYTSSSEQS